MQSRTPAERLVVGVDLPPSTTIEESVERVLRLALQLKRTGVYIKVGSILRAAGYALIHRLHDNGIKVFADSKIFDIKSTLVRDGLFLKMAKPEIVTVSGTTTVNAMKALKEELLDVEVLGVTVLTEFGEDESQATYNRNTVGAIYALAQKIDAAGLDGLVAAGSEAGWLRGHFPNLSINTPNVRPVWYIVKENEDQNMNRVMTPRVAIRAGADRIVVGRPIIEADDPYAATMRTIEEIASAV